MDKIAPHLKAYAALIGSIATALLAVYVEESSAVNHWLTVVAVVATAVGTWVVPNLDPNGTHQGQSVQPSKDRLHINPVTQGHDTPGV